MGLTTLGLTKGYTATAAVAKRRIVKFGAADGTVIQSAGATPAGDKSIGLSTDIDSAIGERCDIYMGNNIGEVECGGVVSRGASVTSDVNGRAVTAAIGNWAIGIAEVSGVNLDIISVIVAPHVAP